MKRNRVVLGSVVVVLTAALSSAPYLVPAAAIPNRAKEDPSFDDEIQRLLKARYDEVAKEVKDVDRVFEQDVEVQNLNRPALLEVYRRFLAATLDLTPEPRLRADLLAPILSRAKRLEAAIEKQMDGGRGSPIETFPVKAFRLEVEIEILRAKKAEGTSRP
jgi:hypothetical protein